MDSRRPAETKVPALRILARTRSPVALAVLLALAQHRRRWFGRRLPSKSPELLAAVAGLASYWADHPMANEVLSDARKHADPEIRAAAGSRT